MRSTSGPGFAIGLALLLLVTTATWLRTTHADYALPYLLPYDEATFALHAVPLASGHLQYNFEFHATSTTPAFLAAVFRLTYAIDRWRGDTADFTTWWNRDWNGPRRAVHAGRVAFGILDTFTVVLVFVLGWRLAATERSGSFPAPGFVGLLAASLYTLSVQAILMSHQLRMDLLMTFFLVAAALKTLDADERGAVCDFVLAGFLAGLAFASKWPAGIALTWILAAALARLPSDQPPARRTAWAFAMLCAIGAALIVGGASHWDHAWIDTPMYRAVFNFQRDGATFLKRNLTVLGLALALFGLGAPLSPRWAATTIGLVRSRWLWAGTAAFILGFWCATPTLLADWSNIVQSAVHHARTTHPPADGDPGLGNLVFYVTHGMRDDLGGLVVALGLAGLAVALIRRKYRDLLVYLAPLLLLAYFSMVPLRWWHYALPFSPFLSLAAARALQELLSRTPRVLAIPGLILVFALPVSRAITTARQFGEPPTQVEATRWFEANVPADRSARVLVEGFGVMLSPRKYKVNPVHSVALLPRTELTPAKWDYVVLCDALTRRFLDEEARYPQFCATYRWILSTWTPIKHITGSGGPVTPAVRIYRTP